MAKATIVFTPNGASEGLTVEALPGGVGVFLPRDGVDSFFPLADIEDTFAESPDTEGGRKTRTKAKNATGSGQLIVSGDSQATFKVYYEELQETVDAIQRFGGTLEYTPAEGTTVTFDVESMRLTAAPYDGTVMLAWVQHFNFEFTCLPYGRLEPVGADLRLHDSFTYDSITNRDWTMEAGTGTISVSSGKLTPSSTAEKRLYRPGIKFSDATHVIQLRTGAGVASGLTTLMLKRLDASNKLYGQLNVSGTTSTLAVRKVDGGA
jgi:hypothetical protein